MMRRDYVVRKLEEFGLFLTRLIRLRKDRLPDELETEILAAWERFSPVEMHSVMKMGLDEFVSTVVQSDRLSHDQKRIIADLLFEEMHRQDMLGNDLTRTKLRNKCLSLYKFLESDAHESTFDLEVHYRLKFLETQT